VNRRILRALLSHITLKEYDVETGIVTTSIFGEPEIPAIITIIRSIFLNPEIFKRSPRDYHKRSEIGEIGVSFIIRYCRTSCPIELN
jgi:hypothetical protein